MTKQPVVLTFGGGLDTKSDEYLVAPAKFLQLQNVIQMQTGGATKRWGYKLLPQLVLGQLAPISSAQALNAFSDELLLYDGTSALSYTPAASAWVKRGEMRSVIQSNTDISHTGTWHRLQDCDSYGGIDVYAWQEESPGGTPVGLRYSVVDTSTGAIVLNNQPLIPSGANLTHKSGPRVVAFPSSGLIYVFFLAQATGSSQTSLYFVTLSPSMPQAIPSVANTLLGGTIPSFDACASIDGATLYVGYSIADSAPGLTDFLVAAYDASLNQKWVSAGQQLTTSSVGRGLCLFPDAGGNIYLSYTTTTPTVDLDGFTSSGARFLANLSGYTLPGGTVASMTGAVASDGVTIRILVEMTPNSVGGPNQLVVGQTYVLSAPQSGTFTEADAVFLRSVGLASRAFTYGANIYANVLHQSNLQPTYFTVDAITGYVVARTLAGEAGSLPINFLNFKTNLPGVATVSAGVFRWSNARIGYPTSYGGGLLATTGTNATTLDFATDDRYRSVAIGGNLYTAGGVLQSYDGAQYVEHGFHLYPETPTSSTSSSGGSIGVGTYYYCVVYEWFDAVGRKQYSAPSVAISVSFSTGSNNSVTLTIPTLRLTSKTGVTIGVYRTQSSASVLQLVSNPSAPLKNDPTVDTVSFTDTLADASIASNTAMYTQPLTAGSNPVLPNGAPPSCTMVAAYADRLFLAGLDDPNTLAYSKPVTTNVPIEFADLLTLHIDPDGGPVTGIVRLDEKFVVFKQHAIFYIVGQGPDATGANNDFVEFVQIPSGGVGAASQDGIVTTPLGVMFSSGNGIYLLDRGLSIKYIGAPVQQYNSLSIVSATVVPNQWVIFLTNSSTALVYDYFYDAWGTFTNHSAVDSCLFLGDGNTFVFVTSDGQVCEQQTGSYQDADGSAIPMALTTAWITEGLNGYQRVFDAFVLGKYVGSHTLTVGVRTNYNEAFRYYAPVNVDQALAQVAYGSGNYSANLFGGMTTDPDQYVYQFRVDILQKCTSVGLQISETEPSPNGAMTLSAITLMVSGKPGGQRLGANKQIGAS